MNPAANTSLSPTTSAPLGLRRGIEKPRPLKCTPSPGSFLSPTIRSKVSSVEDAVTLLERVCEHLNAGNYESPINSAISSLNGALKIFGPQAEGLYKKQVDKLQYTLRNAARDNRLDILARLNLLEIIELRAMNWINNDKVASYYRQKRANIEGSGASTPTTATYLNGNAPDFTLSYLQSPDIGCTVIPFVPSGKVLIPSGKFENPAKVPGNNNFEDEVVIRNADSGVDNLTCEVGSISQSQDLSSDTKEVEMEAALKLWQDKDQNNQFRDVTACDLYWVPQPNPLRLKNSADGDISETEMQLWFPEEAARQMRLIKIGQFDDADDCCRF